MLRRASLDDLEQASCQLSPKVQHRIIRILNEEVKLYQRVNESTYIKSPQINGEYELYIILLKYSIRLLSYNLIVCINRAPVY